MNIVLTTLRATVVGTLFALNTLILCIPIFLLTPFKFISPRGMARAKVSALADSFANTWVLCNSLLTDRLLPTQWDVRGDIDLDIRGQYFVCSNHQTWNDIHVLQKALYAKAPFIKFFLKQELIWVPVLGLCWWALDFPFMRRYTAEQVAKNPSLRGKDIETTRKACEKFEGLPVSIFNFLEGTRFTKSKHAKQNSPFTHLLKPKTGGLAFTLTAMGGKLQTMLDCTIYYPEGAKIFADFLMGRVHRVVVDIRKVAIPEEFGHGDYEGDAEFRKRVQDWVNQLWIEKDQTLSRLAAEFKQ